MLATNTQVVVAAGLVESNFASVIEESFWTDSLLLPLYAGVFSAMFLFGQFFSLRSRQKDKISQDLHGVERPDAQLAPERLISRPKQLVARRGGRTIFLFKVVRLLACIALALLSVISVTCVKQYGDSNHFQTFKIYHQVLVVSYTYTSALSFIDVLVAKPWSDVASLHLVPLLLTPWALFVYRDVWPLITYTLSPADGQEGWLIWAKVALLTVSAIIIPFFSPRTYTPINPKDVLTSPNDEQTASWASLWFFTFCDSVILKAYRQPHLKVEELPTLADTDFAENLMNRSSPILDPLLSKSKRHILWNMVFKVFLYEHVQMALALVARVIMSFLAPLGVNRLLNYIETGGEGAIVRPWFWISWLFFGPMLCSLLFNRYNYIATRTMVHYQAIITQLIFDHSLRIRMKSEVEGSSIGDTAAETTPTTSPNDVTESEGNVSEGDAATSVECGDGQSTSTETASVSAKGKASMKSASDTIGGKTPIVQKKGKNMVGKINNLVTSDLNTLQSGQAFMQLLFYVPFQIILSIFVLYQLVGWSVYTGIAAMVFLAPVPAYIAKAMRGLQAERMKKSDSRVQNVTEIMNVIRMIKLFGWEAKMSDQIAEKREDELRQIRKFEMLKLLNENISSMIPTLTMVITYATYSLIMKKEPTASRVFSSMTIFDMVQDHFNGLFYILPDVIQAKVSMDRINEFLTKTELLDEFESKLRDTEIGITTPTTRDNEDDVIGIRAASFTWSSSKDGSLTPGPNRRSFTLRVEDEVIFKKGCINLIIGQTGCGKTSLLMALLGEMHCIPSRPDSLVSLPRKGGVAFHAQESWILNETIRSNILFGAEYDEKRYNTVIDQCALKSDLSLFQAGDLTEVGEKGLTLSGGQKARVTLARAVYSSAGILLLDDVLAALDVHTARWIVEKCFRGNLVLGRTVLLVTHNIALTSPIADYVVSMTPDGRVHSQGSLSNVLAKDKELFTELVNERKAVKQAEEEVDLYDEPEVKKSSDGKLVLAEEISEGHVGWKPLKLYFTSMQIRGGYVVFWTLYLGFGILSRLLYTLQTGFWRCGLSNMSSSTQKTYLCPTIFLSVIHKMLMDSILGTTLRWLDKTPSSRIIARCTQDIQTIDSRLPQLFFLLMDKTLGIIARFFAVITLSPIFSIPGIVIAGLGGYMGNLYMKAQLPIKRESSNAKAPVLGHFGAAISGLVSIRAYGSQEAFRKESLKRIDKYTRASRVFWNLNRWINIRTDSLAGVFSAGLGAYLVYGGGVSASQTGFSLNMAVGFSGMLLWWVRTFNLFETHGNSLERVQQYLEIEQEPRPSDQGIPPAFWPASGNLVVEKLCARYASDAPKVLHDVTFTVKSGERVGIVGRTGSGKSSLTLALLRCILTEGAVYLDGIDTSTLNLESLRSSITIIPQVPELLRGTLRQNLDPFSQHDDSVLNDALRAAGLFSLQSDSDEARLTLDSVISGGGSNLSVGQRQILALARAMVRQSKLLILDEATSAIDYDTDAIIQTSLRRELNKDVTLLVIAHRLQTIMDADKIMVLDSGRIVEFDTPRNLLRIERGVLKALVDGSGDKDNLYAMAKNEIPSVVQS